ncbi:hypothetical protein EJV47_17555 [Hymenobacter gummosus]|uniref:Uncharacterized protein n=1 Tax=Hymenobacter gummosus TaxID=1776032 RepID=A0A431TZ37_9BACT|nr:hypothetical protein [Hymenobacter gummosus]RTQ47727.1 hypothetical protein EJV47_17555 [Hymenobacter gummosus]
MATQSGQRSQNDPNASSNQGHQQSKQSSEDAQHAGSIEGNRSVQSGVSGIPSQMHRAEDSSTSSVSREQRGAGTAPTDKHGNSRVDSGASDE